MPDNKKTKKGANKDMMNNTVIKKSGIQTINLSNLDGEGSFPCPKCATMISPDDESEEVYKIVDTKVVNNELAELVISCRTCGTTIKLIGFQPLETVTNE
jgi:hypothetical protein